MKILKRKASIYGMYVPRNRAIQSVSKFGHMIEETFMKCIIYGNSTNDYRHWIDDELSTWLRDVAKVTTTTRTGKLKKQEYRDLVFGGLGTDRNDSIILIDEFYYSNVCDVGKYPDFNADDENLITITRKCCDDIIFTFCDIFVDKSSTDMNKQDISKLLHTIMDKYCL